MPVVTAGDYLPSPSRKRRKTFSAWALQKLLDRFVRVGRISITLPDGEQVRSETASGSAEGCDVHLQLEGRWSALRLALDPEFQLAELYATGKLTVPGGSIDQLMEFVGRNFALGASDKGLFSILGVFRRLFAGGNDLVSARHNARFHYDLSDRFYRGFLDHDLQYSCAYFEDPDWDLETAQEAKKAHIAAKLALHRHHKVLDIGCGWGGLALTFGYAFGCDVTGITLSPQQLDVAQRHVPLEKLGGDVCFELKDYRHVTGSFDRIVSVGMLEHVGREHFGSFFTAVNRLLAPGGIALIHSICRKDARGGTNRWIRKRVFPGGYIPSLSELTAAVEKTGLWITDVEVLRLHYAETLKRWRRRFVDHCGTLLEHDPVFFRTWEFYLASCEMSFRYHGLMVAQLQLSNDVAALPITRGYMAVDEQQIRDNFQRRHDRPRRSELEFV